MTFLNKCILLSSLFLIQGCAGATMFISATSGGVVSKYINNGIENMKEYEPVNVKIVKLVSGEELIGVFNEEESSIKDPVVMIPVNNEKIAFSPWMPYSEDKQFKLKKEQITIIATPSKTISNEYNRVFGSGIVVP